jgi:pilus assembly protein Flp/PilA
MSDILIRFVTDETGSTVIEYGLIAFLISIGIIGALTIMGMTLGGIYFAIGAALTAAG